MTDNGSCYRSKTFRAACKRLGLRQIFTRPYTPKTNGKAERFIQTALREWACARAYQNSDQRTAELSDWLRTPSEQGNLHQPSWFATSTWPRPASTHLELDHGEPHGVTIHKMSAEIDRGPVIVQRKVELEPWESSINSTIYALVDSATELFRETWDDLADGSFTFKNPDPRSGSSHRFKDTQEIRDVVNRFADAPIPIFLQEVKARMAVSPSHQPGR
jgi:transposase InsO family protein